MAVFQSDWKSPSQKTMRKLIPLLLFIFLLSGCNTPHSKPTPVAGSTALPYTQCDWNWATQGLPDLSARVEGDMQAAGLKNVTIKAEAYGENCITTAGKVDHFAAMETDFHVTVKVTDLTDRDDLGNLLERILGALDAYPTGKIPGPQPGYIDISFRAGSDELRIRFTVTAGKSARAQGYHGGALIEELQKK